MIHPTQIMAGNHSCYVQWPRIKTERNHRISQYLHDRSGRVALPRAKVKPATPALGVAEAPERRAARVEVRKREAAMMCGIWGIFWVYEKVCVEREREQWRERRKRERKNGNKKRAESDKKVTGRKRHCCSGLGILISPPSDGPLADIDDAVTNPMPRDFHDCTLYVYLDAALKVALYQSICWPWTPPQTRRSAARNARSPT